MLYPGSVTLLLRSLRPRIPPRPTSKAGGKSETDIERVRRGSSTAGPLTCGDVGGSSGRRPPCPYQRHLTEGQLSGGWVSLRIPGGVSWDAGKHSQLGWVEAKPDVSEAEVFSAIAVQARPIQFQAHARLRPRTFAARGTTFLCTGIASCLNGAAYGSPPHTPQGRYGGALGRVHLAATEPLAEPAAAAEALSARCGRQTRHGRRGDGRWRSGEWVGLRICGKAAMRVDLREFRSSPVQLGRSRAMIRLVCGRSIPSPAVITSCSPTPSPRIPKLRILGVHSIQDEQDP
jgi:hypothetical protein